MTQQEIIDMLTHYYELDLDNCAMTNKEWVKELAKALTEPDYLKKLIKEYKTYLSDREE